MISESDDEPSCDGGGILDDEDDDEPPPLVAIELLRRSEAAVTKTGRSFGTNEAAAMQLPPLRPPLSCESRKLSRSWDCCDDCEPEPKNCLLVRYRSIDHYTRREGAKVRARMRVYTYPIGGSSSSRNDATLGELR